jgi:heptosyltransferase-3
LGRVDRLLLVQLGDIGDVVLSLPCIRALKEHFPQAEVVVAVRQKAKTLIEDCPWASDVIAVDQSRRSPLATVSYHARFLRHLRRYRFDVVFDLRAGTRGAIMAWLTGAPLRIGFHTVKETFWRNRVFTHLRDLAPDPHQHQSQRYLSLLTASGVTPAHPLPVLTVSASAHRSAQRLLEHHGLVRQEPLIVFQPFSLWRYKEWRPDKTAALIRRLTAVYGIPVAVIGTAAERHRAQQIVDHAGPGAINLASKTSLRTLTAVIARSRLLVGVDSAGGHIASAVGTPGVVIFGPGKHRVWAPLGEGQRVIYPDLPCAPCDQKGCDGSGVSRCLEDLSVAQVWAVVAEALAGAGVAAEAPTPAQRTVGG